jgi:hypothetical protein
MLPASFALLGPSAAVVLVARRTFPVGISSGSRLRSRANYRASTNLECTVRLSPFTSRTTHVAL